MTRRRTTRDDWLASGGVPHLNARKHLDTWGQRNARKHLGADPTGLAIWRFCTHYRVSVAAVARGLEMPYHWIYARMHSEGLTVRPHRPDFEPTTQSEDDDG